MSCFTLRDRLQRDSSRSAAIADELGNADLIFTAQAVAQPHEIFPTVAPRLGATPLGAGAPDWFPVLVKPALSDGFARYRADGDAVGWGQSQQPEHER